MALSPDEAGAQLAAIDDVVSRVRRSRIYRVTGGLMMMWGGLHFARFLVLAMNPDAGAWSWIPVDGFGIALTLIVLVRAGATPGGRIWRALGAFALFYGFGFLWAVVLARLPGREETLFWHTLFLFGYSLAGLWLGPGFLAIGLGLTAAIFAVYELAGAQFSLGVALTMGFGYLLCGYWMRRA